MSNRISIFNICTLANSVLVFNTFYASGFLPELVGKVLQTSKEMNVK